MRGAAGGFSIRPSCSGATRQGDALAETEAEATAIRDGAL
jgi:hypothetical protein